eukprot:CAMPEP_0114490546 /NCGR_PEP_ID=MMETSP0109-20121206/2501_1 /TAXON_ID=29199 /ORGANISM="Chlorarachnion reptans, Strain CCCM449" /LENGTH=322 /DNA_ID=CAMNT_0001667173 /DNA_START=153 /DNA_END=1121 /DNA_ORIENTATION=+
MDSVLAKMKRLAVHCPHDEHMEEHVANYEKELARITESLAELEMKTGSFDDQVKTAIEKKFEAFKKEDRRREKSVHALEIKLSRAKEKQKLQREWQAEYDAQLILHQQIQGVRVEFERLAKLEAELAAEEQEHKEETPPESQTQTSSDTAPLKTDEEETMLMKQCQEMRRQIQEQEAKLTDAKNEFITTVKRNEIEISAKLKAAKEIKAKNEAAAYTVPQSVPKPAPVTPVVPGDNFLENARARLLTLIEKRAEEQQASQAIALKAILDNGGNILQKRLKQLLRNKLSNPSKATQTIYALVGLRLVKMDRADPRNVRVVSLI